MTTLHDFMRAAGITDQALAQQVGVSRPYITRIRTGERQPSLKVALDLAKITKLPATAFLKRAA